MDFAGDTLNTHDPCGLAVLKSQLEKEQPAPHFFINKESVRYKTLLKQRIRVQDKMNIGYTYGRTTYYLLQHINNYFSLNNCPERSHSQWLAMSYHVDRRCVWNVPFKQNRDCRMASWGNLPRHWKSEQRFSSRKRHKTQFALTKQKGVAHKPVNEILAIVRWQNVFYGTKVGKRAAATSAKCFFVEITESCDCSRTSQQTEIGESFSQEVND